ncbi:MAG: glycosyltransferase [Clostridiales bacterium]|nr:glycosyltransferase [Clostridiales bacterium]
MPTALIIPAYEPDEKLLGLLAQFAGNADFVPIIVNDGSSEKCRAVFDRLPAGCELLTHPQNRGKGAALKTAMRHVLDKHPECTLAVTADADGQHKYADILRVTASAAQRPGTLVLGSRRFDGDVPAKSRIGNSITRHVFSIASGVKVYDTQTGLRAFDRKLMAEFLEISGDRYEYEINMLLSAAQSGTPIVEEVIETVYLDENASSHFNPFRDSFKIYMCIFKFCASSLLAFVVDYVLVLLFNAAFLRMFPREKALLFSVVLARIISATVNFLVNRKVVFNGNESLGKSAAKYAALAVCVLIVNYFLIRFLNITLGWPLALAKILVEVILFLANFVIQGKFVYRKGRI